MVKKWFNMKKKEIELKLLVYTYALDFLKNKDEIFSVMKDAYTALEGISQDELKDALMSIIAEKIHEETEMENNIQ